jgi:hypothetical protein
MCKKKSPKKPKPKPTKKPAIEVLPPEEATPPVIHVTALARADAVIRSADRIFRGVIPTQRASHGSAWQNLVSEDQTIRQQILEVKAKENEVLGMIRDRVAANLVETLDTAIEQGVLVAPEEV